MKLQPISKKEAREIYGVLTNGVNSMYSYYLREDGCVVDSDGDLRYAPPYERSMYVADITVSCRGKSYTAQVYSKIIECVKQDATLQAKYLCSANNLPIGDVFIDIMISQNDEFVDHDEMSARWNGKDIEWEV